jgi:hypothetical protein
MRPTCAACECCVRCRADLRRRDEPHLDAAGRGYAASKLVLYHPTLQNETEGASAPFRSLPHLLLSCFIAKAASECPSSFAHVHPSSTARPVEKKKVVWHVYHAKRDTWPCRRDRPLDPFASVCLLGKQTRHRPPDIPNFSSSRLTFGNDHLVRTLKAKCPEPEVARGCWMRRICAPGHAPVKTRLFLDASLVAHAHARSTGPGRYVTDDDGSWTSRSQLSLPACARNRKRSLASLCLFVMRYRGEGGG